MAVKPADVASLTAALDECLALSPEQLQTKGDQAYRYLTTTHNIDVFRAEYLALVESGLAAGRGARA